MNTRDYKLFQEGSYYHIYNRGDNKENIFLDDEDYLNFIKRLKIILGISSVPNSGSRGALRLSSFPPGSFEILAYCLMPNHFHIVIKQNGSHKIGQLITRLCTSYVKYFNGKYKRVGNLFQDTFKAKLVERDEYLYPLSAYIHNNPPDPATYIYSSFQEYLFPENSEICITSFILNSFFNNNPEEYKAFVLGSQDKEDDAIADLLFEE